MSRPDPQARLIPGLVMLRWDAPLFFANAELFNDRVLDAIASSPTPVHWLVVAAEPVTSIDVTGGDVLSELSFIRLLGGGIVGAVAGPLAGCSMFEVPPSAVAAWQGPSHETELRRWVLSYALLAPNPHNMQPWLADLRREGEIVLRLDPNRLLPATDPYGRQILMGSGAFLELLAMAAAERGHRAEIELFPMACRRTSRRKDFGPYSPCGRSGNCAKSAVRSRAFAAHGSPAIRQSAVR